MRRCRWQGLRAAAVALLPWEGQGRPKCALPGPPLACPKCALETSEDSSQSSAQILVGTSASCQASISFPAESYITGPPPPPDRTTHVIYHMGPARQRGGGGEPGACGAVPPASMRAGREHAAHSARGEGERPAGAGLGGGGPARHPRVLAGARRPLPAASVENEQNTARRRGPGLTGTARAPWAEGHRGRISGPLAPHDSNTRYGRWMFPKKRWMAGAGRRAPFIIVNII